MLLHDAGHKRRTSQVNRKDHLVSTIHIIERGCILTPGFDIMLRKTDPVVSFRGRYGCKYRNHPHPLQALDFMPPIGPPPQKAAKRGQLALYNVDH